MRAAWRMRAPLATGPFPRANHSPFSTTASPLTPQVINTFLSRHWEAIAHSPEPTHSPASSFSPPLERGGAPPLNRGDTHSLNGCVCHEISRRHALVSRLPTPADIRPGGYVCGPFQFALADVGMWFACFGAYDRIEPMALTSELSIRFVRPAVVPDERTKLWARVDVQSVGQRKMVSSATIWVDAADRPTAIAQGTYVMPQ
ncbi:hypothetical protein AB1Y20_007620 [Prymnesium parvum]|uniref:Thioesterase domain-containing protein n=1 Tax=Prymnesium parvum TaxID=97485 RepID=A0AB34IYH5_PRYPA